ncbi:MAG: DUF2062 domain-containing protein [bacterium]
MPARESHRSLFNGLAVCVIIPTYNNGGTILSVIRDVKSLWDHVVVINDGSTDNTAQLIAEVENIEVVSYSKNRGKGFALRKGFERAVEMGFDYAVTIDADGQHYAEDLQVFSDTIRENEGALLIGSRNISKEGMPAKNTLANKFSNFWFWVETGMKLPDTQSGFRLYPLTPLKNIRFFSSRYEFEVEVLVRAAWKGVPILPVPVRVDYPEERVTHFRPFRDFSRISILNTILVLVTFLYIIPRNAFLYLKRNKLKDIIREQLVAHNESPYKIAAASGFGVFMGIAPIWGFQMILAALLAHFMRLNKIIVLAASNISIPPMIPVQIYFSYQTGGLLMTNDNKLTRESVVQLKNQVLEGHFYSTLRELGYNLLQYVTGAFVFGAAMGIAAGIIVYIIAAITKSSVRPKT